MDIDQAVMSLTGDGNSDDEQIPGGRLSSHSGESLRFKTLERVKRLGTLSKKKKTPIRPSLLAASPVSSASSSSTNSSIFDKDSSPGTPLTPPLAEKVHPTFPRRSRTNNLKKPSTLSFKGKHPKGNSSFNACPSPTAQTPRSVSRYSSTPELQEQDAEQPALGTMDNVSLELDDLYLNESPAAKKSHRMNLRREADAVTIRLMDLSLESNDMVSRRRTETTDEVIGDVSPEALAPEEVPSAGIPDHDIDMLDGDEHEASEVLLPEIEIESKKVAEDELSSPAPGVSTSNKVQQARVGRSPIIPTSRLSKTASASKKPTKSSYQITQTLVLVRLVSRKDR